MAEAKSMVKLSKQDVAERLRVQAVKLQFK